MSFTEKQNLNVFVVMLKHVFQVKLEYIFK